MRSAVAAFLVALLVPVVALPAVADPGDIDAGWGFFGRVSIADMTGDPVVPAGSDRILVPVSSGSGGTVARFDLAGHRDQTFAPAGTVPFAITTLVELPSGILALGRGNVARYTTDGQLDRTFGVNGTAALPEGILALAASQRSATAPIYVGGSIAIEGPAASSCSSTDPGVAAFTPAGALDTRFGSSTPGVLHITPGRDDGVEDEVSSLLAVDDGVILGVSTRVPTLLHGCYEAGGDDSGRLVHYLADGRLDYGFAGERSFVQLPTVRPTFFEPRSKVAIAPFGTTAMMVTAGHEVWRMRLDGGRDAWYPVPATTAQSIVADGQGRYVVGGSRLARLWQPPSAGYAVDTAFGSCGYTNVAGTPIPAGDHLLVRQGQLLLRLDSGAGPAAPLGSSHGAWVVDAGGAVHTSGDALWCGPGGPLPSRTAVVGIAVAPSQNGYWVVTADGAVERFGHAGHFGDLRGRRLNQPVVGMAATPSGNGYWLVARDGGIFSFGDAHFFGSTGNIRLNKPIVGMTSSPSGSGYWFVASDGGIFSYGDARFHGSTGARPPATPIVGMASTPSGQGYFLVAAGGGVYPFGDAGLGGAVLQQVGRVVGISASGPTAFRVYGASGAIASYGTGDDLRSVSSGRPIVAGASGR